MISYVLLLLLTLVSPAIAKSASPVTCCGGFLMMLIVVVIIGLIGDGLKKGTEENIKKNLSPAKPSFSPTGLEILISEENKDVGLNEGATDCFVLKIGGAFQLPPNTLAGVFSLSLWDVTNGEAKDKRKQVLCYHPQFQLIGTQVFLWTHTLQMGGGRRQYNDWVEILPIPIELLTFPSKGSRKLLFELTIASMTNIQNPVAKASYVYYYFNDSMGYIDGIKLRIKGEELGLRMAAAVSAVDGSLDKAEKAVIRKWMDTRIDSLPKDMRDETTRKLSRALLIAERISASIKPDEIEMLCEDTINDYPINSIAKGDLYDIVELCMNVAAADGIAEPTELELVDKIAKLLKIDPDKLRTLSEKLLPVNIHSAKNIDNILGLKPEWTSKEKKKHLREQYREWSARVTHSDAKIRDQADEMLKLIAEERAKLDAEG